MAFQQGLSGLNSSSKALDVAGNNIANASTVGFKSSASHFADVYGASLQGSTGSQTGIGSTLSAVMQQFTQGNITSTNNPLDIAINGTGFFGLSQNGSTTYSRNGQFHLDKDGYIVNDQGRKLLGVLANASGSIPNSQPEDMLKVDFVTGRPSPTTEASITANLDSRLTPATQYSETTSDTNADGVPDTVTAMDPTSFDPLDSDTYNTSTAMTVYDSLGNPHTLGYYFVKSEIPNQWYMFTTLDGAVNVDGAGDPEFTTMNFSSAGVLTSPATMPTLNYDVATGADPMYFDLNVSNITQFGSPFAVNDLTQDGFTPGNLAGISVSKDGIIQARYDNGQTRDIGLVALFNFRNPNGLASIGNNQWTETGESGQPTPGNPNTGIFGVLQASAIEESNVDLTAELVNLIVHQRNYQASAQSIKTQDQILQTLVNIR